ncbi:MAG TPA: DnaJ domain-containing protein [Stellaceae bacterium]|nr:DnaJ domain-containing protein [Stellaceae bacterium]
MEAVLYFTGGVAILGGLLALLYLFVNADPLRLARALKIVGIAVLALLLLALALFTGVFVFFLSLPLLWGIFSRHGRRFAGWQSAFRSTFGGRTAGAGGQTSTVTTPFLRMTLDHDTGMMSGTILAGRFAGMRLDELAPGELLALLRECRSADEEGARLLEAYLDRVHPDWRDELQGERAGPHPGSGTMSAEEAYAILGLAPGAGPDEIKEAHRRLMIKLHPDHGGSDYLATQINQARDVLLHRR